MFYMKVKIHDMEIDCPDKQQQVVLVLAMNPIQAHYLSNRQKEPKNWPNHTNIPEYCLYMGSGEVLNENGLVDKIDFYHYESADEYSTAIVYGDEGGDYRSGWPELANRRDAYREQLRREFHCGFLTVDDLMRVGMATLGVEKTGCDTIRPMRKKYRIERELE